MCVPRYVFYVLYVLYVHTLLYTPGGTVGCSTVGTVIGIVQYSTYTHSNCVLASAEQELQGAGQGGLLLHQSSDTVIHKGSGRERQDPKRKQ